MRVQRKIHHLLANNGEIGGGFRYLPTLNPLVNFNWKNIIIVTDKIDGTTVQADSQNIYKRYDKLRKGDPKKLTATEDERYGLKKLSEEDPANKWIFKARDRYRKRFSRMKSGLMVYFECFGDKINARYKGREQDIRVFDFALDDEYISFENILGNCEEIGLPPVGSFNHAKFGEVTDIIKQVAGTGHIDLKLAGIPLEGWVLRQGEHIAKIRKNDLSRILEVP